MEFRDLKTQYKVLKTDIDSAILNCINGGKFIMGKEVVELENQLAQYVGVKHCISCANGTDALILSLMAYNIGKGDAVFVPDFTFFASLSCAMIRGASPVLVDIDQRSFNISPKALEDVIKNTINNGKLKPKAIIAVDLFGQCADYTEITNIAKKYNLILIEDAAQGFGGSFNGQKACSFGDVATTSFFPAKPLGCYGDGGAIFTNNDDMAMLLRSLRLAGRSDRDKYDNIRVGLNSRLDTVQAAILIVKLKAFKDYELNAVNNIANKYTDLLKEHIITPYVGENKESSWAQYTILLKNNKTRNDLIEYLKTKNIPTMVYYPKAMHNQNAVINAGCNKGEFINTNIIVQTCLSLPMHPYMSDSDVEYIAQNIIYFINNEGK